MKIDINGKFAVNRIGFGAMRLPTGSFHGPPRDPAVGHAVLRRAVELGVDHIDTADFYRSDDGKVRANDLIREALYPYPPHLAIATKVGPKFSSDGSYIHGKAADMRELVEANLESLGLDCLDLVYLRVGGMVQSHGESIAERFEALAALRDEGLIRNLGLSNVDLPALEEATRIAPVVAVQNLFHIADRTALSLLDACEDEGIAFVPFFPLGGGVFEIDDGRLRKIAFRRGATPAQIALAWILAYSPATLAIPGTASISHLEENMAAGAIRLTEEDLNDLD